MTSAQGGQAHRYIHSIRHNLARLEDLLRDMEAEPTELRPHDARSELLEQVHLVGSIEQRRLFELLDQRSMSHTLVGGPSWGGVPGPVARSRRTDLLPGYSKGDPRVAPWPTGFPHQLRRAVGACVCRRLAERRGLGL